MSRRRQLFRNLLFWILSGALAGHLAAPVCYLAGIAGVRAGRAGRIRQEKEIRYIRIPAAEADQWYHAGDGELVANGQHYDVIRVERGQDLVTFKVIPDRTETRLQQGLRQSTGNREAPPAGFRFWLATFYEAPAPVTLPGCPPAPAPARWAFPDACKHKWTGGDAAPPPWHA